MGIAEYNSQCRGIVMRYSKEWEVSSMFIGILSERLELHLTKFN